MFRYTRSIVGLGISLIALGQPLFAQGGPPQDGPPPQRGGPRGFGPRGPMNVLPLWTNILTLTADEQKAVQPILEQQNQDMRTMMQDQTLSPDDRRAKMKTIQDASNTAIRALLTADQQAKFDAVVKLQTSTRPAGPPAPGTIPPAPTTDTLLPLWTTILGLTTDEQAAVKPILDKLGEDVAALAQNQDLDPRAQMMQRRQLQIAADAKIKAALTTDQQTQFQALQQLSNQGPGGRRPGGFGGPGRFGGPGGPGGGPGGPGGFDGPGGPPPPGPGDAGA